MTLRKLETIIEDVRKTITVRVLQEYKEQPLVSGNYKCRFSVN